MNLLNLISRHDLKGLSESDCFSGEYVNLHTKNKDKAMKMLYSKLYESKLSEQTEKIASQRRIQVGTGDRSERIRTYNYPQSRVTDHRIGLTLYKLEQIMNGDCDELFDALAIADRAAKLAGSAE